MCSINLRIGMRFPFAYIGYVTLRFINELGNIVMMLMTTLIWALRPPWRWRLVIKQMEFVGVKSTFIVVLTGTFTGMVFALQSRHAFELFNANYLIGPTVVLGLTRELGPVLASLMVTGRAGSAIAAELGTMRVTEQIDALHTMAVNPIQYLLVPRLFAGITMAPLLTALFSFCGTLGCYVVTVYLIEVNPHVFWREILLVVDLDDLWNGLIKAAFFGLILTLIGCYKGFYTDGGAEGVGRATTESVVIASVSILISDYFLTALMF